MLVPRGKNHERVSYIVYLPRKELKEVAPEGNVALVFTDIQSSTSLWDRCPEAMSEALRRHDRILRKLLKILKGYEVKTEGDAFMVAFSKAIDAIRWCTRVQKALLEAKWSQPLLQQPAAKEEKDDNGQVIFAGIRVRMGIHVGPTESVRNPVSLILSPSF